MKLTYTKGLDTISWEIPTPERLPVAGDVMIVTRMFFTLGGEQYYEGDKLYIIERTQEAPHGRLLDIGNLKVKGKNGQVTIWTNIEMAMGLGMLGFVK